MADVKLPGVGPVSKKWVVIIVGASAVTIGYVVIRRKSSAAAATTSTDTTTGDGTDTSGQIDPETGDIAGSAQDQMDLASLQDSGYGTYGDTGLGAAGYGTYYPPVASTIPGAGGFTTNGEWSQQAETDLGGVGVNQTTLAAALGNYLTGRQLSSAQESLVNQAIAMEGYPPVGGTGGYPPAMRTSSTNTGGGSGPGYRHVASGIQSLDTLAKSRHTTASEIESATRDSKGKKGGIDASNLTKFNTYVSHGTSKKMPVGLVYFTTNP